MAKKQLPTIPRLRQLLTYDPDTGLLTWKERPLCDFPSRSSGRAWNTRWAGKEALASNIAGYKHGAVDYVHVRAHRAAWALFYGAWPADMIDHINGDRRDNRISNLRIATAKQNSVNRKSNKSSTSGYLGVSWNAIGRNWRAQIAGLESGSSHIGVYQTQEEAARAYDREAKRLRGDFARTNFG